MLKHLVKEIEQIVSTISIQDAYFLFGDNTIKKYPTSKDIYYAFRVSGKSRQDVANHFFISVHTAKKYIYRPPQKKYTRLKILEYLQNV